mmetsp:Transcript_38253/g.83595  ORF Transcript_38253/g.83595 Transcript_38253/m.83595 type:complete len:224 (+) Transcript_38253:1402-2073(+)
MTKTAKLICKKLSRLSTSCRSTIPRSLENLDKIRPDGVVSNHDMGAFSTRTKQSMCRVLEARRPASANSKEHKFMQMMWRRTPAAYRLGYVAPASSDSADSSTHNANKRSPAAIDAYEITPTETEAAVNNGPIALTNSVYTEVFTTPSSRYSAATPELPNGTTLSARAGNSSTRFSSVQLSTTPPGAAADKPTFSATLAADPCSATRPSVNQYTSSKEWTRCT